MNTMQLLHSVSKNSDKKRPTLKPGITVKVHQKIKEGNKERIQIFEGLVIAINPGVGADATFTVRKLVGGIGVEKIFLLHSPLITKIQVVKEGNVRRAKLYYMRKLRGKAARLREKFLTAEEMEVIEEEPEVKAEEASEKTTEEPTVAPVEKADSEPKEEEPQKEEAETKTDDKPAEEKAEKADAPEVKEEESKKE